MIYEDRLWERVPVTMQGVQLNYPKEIIQAQFPDISLTIPSLKFGDVGCFVVTNQRFIFLMYQRTYALSFNHQGNIISSQSSFFPDNSNLAVIKLVTSLKTYFTVQGYQSYILQLSQLILPIQETTPAANTNLNKKVFTTNKTKKQEDFGGMKGIIKNSEDNSKQRSDTINAGIKDIESLRQAAQSLKEVARQLAEQVNRNDSEQVQSLDDIYLIIGDNDKGESSIKHKKKSKKGKKGHVGQFEIELAKDFSSVMATFFKKKEEISFLTPAEAFVIFNKAQLVKAGGDLISPKDLMHALDVIEGSSEYPIRVESMDIVHEDGSKSTNLIIVEKGKSFDSIAERLSSLKDGEYVTAFSLSKQLKISEEIVQWYLGKALSNKLIAIDSSYAGDRYYKNIFSTFSPMKI